MSSEKLERLDFPNVGSERFFKVKHNPKNRTKPVTVELHESTISGRRVDGFSRLLGSENTIATKADVLHVAKIIEARVGRIDEVVGEY